jgi:hypothetical protein
MALDFLYLSSSVNNIFFFGLHSLEQKTGRDVSFPQVLQSLTIDHLDNGLEWRLLPVLLCDAAHDLEQNFFWSLPNSSF